MPLNGDETQALDLIINIMEANSKYTADLTNSLMDSYKAEAALARAELKAVRIQVQQLFDAGYMPTEFAIRRALIPNPALVQDIIELGNI
jgi:hypothetical protein